MPACPAQVLGGDGCSFWCRAAAFEAAHTAALGLSVCGNLAHPHCCVVFAGLMALAFVQAYVGSSVRTALRKKYGLTGEDTTKPPP